MVVEVQWVVGVGGRQGGRGPGAGGGLGVVGFGV